MRATIRHDATGTPLAGLLDLGYAVVVGFVSSPAQREGLGLVLDLDLWSRRVGKTVGGRYVATPDQGRLAESRAVVAAAMPSKVGCT